MEGNDAQALHLFEVAMEKEQHGLMSDAIKYYRSAFKLNERVDLLYRKHKVPQAMAQHRDEHGKNSGRQVDMAVVKNIKVDQLLQSFAMIPARAPDEDHPDADHITIKVAGLDLNAPSREVSPLLALPEEIWVHVLKILIDESPEAWFKFGITCKRNAFLAFASLVLWRHLCYLIYPLQSYEENAIEEVVPLDPLQVLPQYGNSWKRMLRDRPFLKFMGCYISVVNYYSEGGRAELSSSLSNPVRVVTYYRYLRFYPNGECVMALTRLAPLKVVSQFLRKNKLGCIVSNYESRDMSRVNPADEPHKIFRGRWTLSTDSKVHVVVEHGLVPYYTFHYHFTVGNIRAISNHCKLSWDRFYGVWKRTESMEEREGEVVDFSLKSEKDFKFLRVRSYTIDN